MVLAVTLNYPLCYLVEQILDSMNKSSYFDEKCYFENWEGVYFYGDAGGEKSSFRALKM